MLIVINNEVMGKPKSAFLPLLIFSQGYLKVNKRDVKWH